MNSIIYLGLAINIIGAVLLAIFAVGYYREFKEAERLTVKIDNIKTRWIKKRALAFGLMIGGTAIALIGCYL